MSHTNLHSGYLLGHEARLSPAPVHVSLAPRLLDDVLIVVVTQPARQLLVVHLGLVLAVAPPPGHLDKVD